MASDKTASRFERLDLDTDGRITSEEAYRVRVQEFSDMDASRDGRVDEQEFAGRARPFEAFDGDEDGTIELSEYLASHRSMFDKFDQDGSGSLTFEEFQEAQEAARRR